MLCSQSCRDLALEPMMRFLLPFAVCVAFASPVLAQTKPAPYQPVVVGAPAAAPGASDSTSSIAAASRSRPSWWASSTARIVSVMWEAEHEGLSLPAEYLPAQK